MAATIDQFAPAPPLTSRIARKAWREVSRPFRRLAQSAPKPIVEEPQPEVVIPVPTLADFHPLQATVESEGVPLIQRLVRESRQFPGPIIEIGTLLGITTTTMAMVKAVHQKIITVDLYCWNPWGVTPEVHEALASQILRYLVETGHVDRVTMDKEEFYRTYNGPEPAMVFLDAMHDYESTRRDIEWASRAGAKIIAGHDYCDKFPGVIKVVDEFGGPRELGGCVWALETIPHNGSKTHARRGRAWQPFRSR